MMKPVFFFNLKGLEISREIQVEDASLKSSEVLPSPLSWPGMLSIQMSFLKCVKYTIVYSLVQLVCSTVRWKVLVCCKVCECVLKGWSDPPLPPSRLTRLTSPHTCHRKHLQHWQHSTPDPHFKTLEILNNPQFCAHFPQNTTRAVVTKHIIRQGTAAGGWGHFDNGARDAVD